MTVSFITTSPPVSRFRYRIIETSWGYLAYVSRGTALCKLLLFERNKQKIEKKIINEFPSAIQDKTLLEDLRLELLNYLNGDIVQFDCRIDTSWAGDFAGNVWRCCCRIKPGQTISYGQLAARIGKPKAARAVAGALARNRVPLIIPCHRIIAADGSLGGYSATGGKTLKGKLLKLEQAAQFQP